MLPSPDRIEYEATIEDPKVSTSPWKIVFAMNHRTEKGYEQWEDSRPEGERDVEAMLLGGRREKEPAEQASMSIAERDRSKMAETVGDSFTG